MAVTVFKLEKTESEKRRNNKKRLRSRSFAGASPRVSDGQQLSESQFLSIPVQNTKLNILKKYFLRRKKLLELER